MSLAPCRPSPLSERVYDEANRIAPARNRGADGTCPSPAHHATNPDSDHEPWNGISQAVDLTHDPAHGFDSYYWARVVAKNIAAGKEQRVKYIISNRQIFEGGVWKPFYGGDDHTGHSHTSWNRGYELSTAPFLVDLTTPPPKPVDPILDGWASVSRRSLKPRDRRRPIVLLCAHQLRDLGYNFRQTRGYRYSLSMRAAVQRLQRTHGLPATGNIGHRTYAVLFGLHDEAG